MGGLTGALIGMGIPKEAGFSNNDVSVLFTENKGTKDFCPREEHQSARGCNHGGLEPERYWVGVWEDRVLKRK